MFPTIIMKNENGERSLDTYTFLLQNRVVFLGTEINEKTANSIIGQLLYLQMEDPKKDIKIYINSPGGAVSDGLALYDTIQYLSPDVQTICIGSACSMAAILLAAGTKGKRCAFPHSNIMIHQPYGWATGPTSDMIIRAEYANRLKRETENILHKHTDIPIEDLQKYMDRDRHMTATEAKSLGMIDDIISKKEAE